MKRTFQLVLPVVVILAMFMSFMPTHSVQAAGTTYTWNQTGTASWAVSTNWTPERITPATTDILQFNGGGTVTVKNVPTQTIAQLLLSNNTTVNLQAGATATLTIGGDTGTDLDVPAGSALNFNGATNVLTVFVGTGATGSISGNMTCSTAAHKLNAQDASAITFNSGATLTQDTGCTGNIFTAAGTANAIVFTSGSIFVFKTGSNPFGLGAPNSKVVFQSGSTYSQQSSNTPSFSGRTYANFEYNYSGTISGSGTGGLTFDNLTVIQGILNMGMTGSNAFNLKGNISVASGATLNFSPSSAGLLTFNGTSLQTISGLGNLTFGNDTIAITNPSGVELQKDISTGANIVTLNGPSFSGSGDVVGSVKRIGPFTPATNYGFNNVNIFINFASITTPPGDITVTLAKSNPDPGIFVNPILRKYSISTTGSGTFDATLQLRYTQAEVIASGAVESNLKLYQKIAGVWTLQSATQDTTNHLFSVSGVTAFLDWAIAEGLVPSTSPSGIGSASPTSQAPGRPVNLSVTVTPGTGPISTGLAVTCDLTAIDGSATQVFADSGGNIFTYSATIAGGTTAGVKSMGCTIGDAQSRSGSATIGLTVLQVLPIGTVNGAISDTTDPQTHNADFVGQIVTVQGVIYEKAIQPKSGGGAYYGFFIQNTAATRDPYPNTSDGLYVFMNTNPTIGTYTPTVGDEVILTGGISEYYNMTELSNPTLVGSIIRSGVILDSELPPVVANPPINLADANRYWERLQAMRVQVPANSVVLGGRNVFDPPDGEVWVARADSTVGLRTTDYTNRAFRDAHPLDDNYNPTVWDGNGYRILMGSWGLKAAAGDPNLLIDPLHTFETITNSPVGGINYSFSKYRIEVTTQPTVSEGLDPALNNPPQGFDRSIAYSIVDYNLENLYDFRDNPFSGCDFAGNSGCPARSFDIGGVTSPFNYVPASDAAYQARLTDIATQIINDLHSPDVLMVQEVENQDICTVSGGALTCGLTNNADGKPDILQELALKIASLGGPAYDAAWDPDSSDLRGIAPAYLYRTDRVTLVAPAGDPILGMTPTIDYPGTAVAFNADISNPKTLNANLPGGVTACEVTRVFPRAPDIALFRIYKTSVGAGSYIDVYTINNHFKSGPDTCIPHRTEQAKYNAAIVAAIQLAKPGANIVVAGDFNVYPRPDDIALNASDQLGSLYDPSLGLKNLWEVLLGEHPESAYSYVYLGMAQTLDQMFVSQSLLTDLKEFRIAHINSDFAADYPGDFARGTSDHDPNMATFIINDPPTVDAGGPYTVDEGSSVILTATGTDPENGLLTYAWDLNNDGTFETPGQSVSFLGINGPSTDTVNVQVTDNGGLTATASTTVTVNNVAPTASAGGPYTVDEGSSITLTATGTDPGNDPLTYVWDLNNDGTFETPGQSVTFLGINGPSIETVSVQVTDDGGLSTIASTTVTVNNVAPTASAGGPYTVDEGSSITLTATGTDPGNDPLTYAWDLNNDGTFETAGQSVPFVGIDGPATLTVSVQVTDDGGLSTVDTTTITVNNVAPTLGPITGPTEPVAISLPVSISAAFTDPGILDTHTAVITWGDGTTSAGSITESGGSGTVSDSHTYTTPGVYTISMTVTDKDGGVSNTVTYENVVVYDADAGFVTAGGWFTSPDDGYKAKFEINAKYHKGSIVPEGKTKLNLTDTLLFNSIRYDWLVVAGNTAMLKGTGTINDEEEYLFMVMMVDASPDTIQIKIWDADGVVCYDTLTGIVLGGGNISIKK